MASDNWSIKGNYFESCTCDLICPCIVLKPPTTGTCTALLGWHIDEGHLDDLEINDLNVSMFLEAPGLLTEGGFKVALYVASVPARRSSTPSPRCTLASSAAI